MKTAVRFSITCLCCFLFVLAATSSSWAADPAPSKPDEKKEQASPKPGEGRVFAGIEFAWVPPGGFNMNFGFVKNEPSQWVTLPRGFWMGRYEVTQGQWESVMGNNPSYWKGDPQRPVESVSWVENHEFIAALNAKNPGLVFRLPTEAEWEYACRAGSLAKYFFGDDPAQLKDYAWFVDNSDNTSHPVGQKKPNAWGLYDMLGNVWESVEDWFGPIDGVTQTDPKGPEKGIARIRRGGGWAFAAEDCTSYRRLLHYPYFANNCLGFRLVCERPVLLNDEVFQMRSIRTAAVLMLLVSLLCGCSASDTGAAPVSGKNESTPPPTAATALAAPVPAPPASTAPEPNLKPGEVRTFAGIDFAWIPPGSFMMGSNVNGAKEAPAHRTTITHGFWLGTCELTQAQWVAVMGNNPSHWKDNPQNPVEQVSWKDAHKFIDKLNTQNPGMNFRLPTEAEWEYANRAGTSTSYCFGEDVPQLKDYSWFYENSENHTHPVGQKKANPWGLHDMYGNVLEIVEDRWGPYSAAAQVDPKGAPETAPNRVRRGGAWYYVAERVCASERRPVQEDYANSAQGLRLAR